MLWKTKWCSDNRLCEIDTTVQYAFWYAYILCIYVQPYIISVLSMCVTGNSTSGKFKRSKKHCRINSSLTVDAHWSVDLNWIRSAPEVIWKGIWFSGLTFPHSHTYHLLGRVYTKLTFESTGKSYANHMTLPVKPVLDHLLTSIIYLLVEISCEISCEISISRDILRDILGEISCEIGLQSTCIYRYNCTSTCTMNISIAWHPYLYDAYV